MDNSAILVRDRAKRCLMLPQVVDAVKDGQTENYISPENQIVPYAQVRDVAGM
jgi:hypothetical protein